MLPMEDQATRIDQHEEPLADPSPQLSRSFVWTRVREVVAGEGTTFDTETARILRIRLRGALSMITAAILVVFLVELLRPGAHFSSELVQYARGVALIVEFGFLAILFSRLELSHAALRTTEVASFLTLFLLLAVILYGDLMQAAETENLASAAALLKTQVLANFAVVVVYGMYIPNTWKRALCVMLPPVLLHAFVPILALIQAPFLQQIIGTGVLLEGTIIRLLGVTAATYALHLIHGLRTEVYEARQMGQYHLKEQLGAGGMGEVWKAEHRLLARPAAVKLIKPDNLGHATLDGGRALTRRFEREAKSTAALRSPHTIVLYDFGSTAEGTFYYAMELLEGLDLKDLVERFGPVPPERAIHFLAQACDSLAEAHRTGLVHRDIKPANLYSCRLGVNYDFLKVLDFGLVKDRVQPEGDETQLTQVGMTTGTPSFISPEAALGKATLDGRSDIYALGCVGYWLVTGQLVFEADSPIAMALAHLQETPGVASSVSEFDIPQGFDDVIASCLSKKPGDRPATAEQLAGLLRSIPISRPWDPARAEEWWRINHPIGN